MRFYGETANHVAAMRNVIWHNVVTMPVDAPEDLRPPTLDFQVVERLRVAYGLSYPTPDFGSFVDPADVPNLEAPPRPRLEDLYPSKDVV
jgi:hypothetical protein